MLQAISRAERLNMLPEDYKLRKQFLLKDCKEELQTILSVMKNNPYSSDLLEYSKSIQNEINDLGYFCIMPRPDSPNAVECYNRTLKFLKNITEEDCDMLAIDQYANIDIYDLLGETICLHHNKVRDLLLQFFPNTQEVNEELEKYKKYLEVFKKASKTSMTGDEAEILNKYFLKYQTRIIELRQRINL